MTARGLPAGSSDATDSSPYQGVSVKTPGHGLNVGGIRPGDSPAHLPLADKDHIDARYLHNVYGVKSKKSVININKGTFQTLWADLLFGCRHSRPSDVMPIVGWFPKFLKNNPCRSIVRDVICGVTITAIVVPQGMAYGMLASLPPVNGLYTAMLPVLGYTLFGTCMHLSIGPFALISMLTAEGIIAVVPNPEENPEDAIEAARQLAFFSACILTFLGIFRLGFIGTFLSDPVLSGYCTAVSFIIPTSQLKHALQADVKRAAFIDTIRQLIEAIGRGEINGFSFGIFVISLTTLYLLQLVNKKKPFAFLKKFPLPAELCVTVLSTLVCYLFDFENTQNVRVTGKIPPGLPVMKLPKLGHFPTSDLLPAALMIALMTYITAMSVSKTFARKFGYEVENNKELLALGFSNFLGSISSCYPAAASLSRTAVVGSSGAATPLHNIWMVMILGFVLIACGPLIETLPNAALAAIVVMAFKSLLLGGYEEMKTTWAVSKQDFLMWSIAFWLTLGTNVTIGIAIAVASDVIYLFYKTTRPTFGVLGRLAGTQAIYCNRKNFEEVEPIRGVLIFRFDGPLHFANKEVFLSALLRQLRVAETELNGRTPSTRDGMQFWSHMNDLVGAFIDGFVMQKQSDEAAQETKRITSVVLDCSPMTHVDMTAARALDKLRVELEGRKTKLVLAHCKYVCYTKLHDMGFFKVHDDGEYDVVCFRELHDAVLWAEGKLGNTGKAEESVTIESSTKEDFEDSGSVLKTLSNAIEKVMSPNTSSKGSGKGEKRVRLRSNSSLEELEKAGVDVGPCEDSAIFSITTSAHATGPAPDIDVVVELPACTNRTGHADAQTETQDGELLAEHLPEHLRYLWSKTLVTI